MTALTDTIEAALRDAQAPRFRLRDWALLSTAAIAAALIGTAGLTAIEMAARWAAN